MCKGSRLKCCWAHKKRSKLILLLQSCLNFGLTGFAKLVISQMNCGIYCKRSVSRSRPWLKMAALVRLQSKHSVGTEKDSIAISLPTAESHRKRPPRKDQPIEKEALRLNQSYRVSRCMNVSLASFLC